MEDQKVSLDIRAILAQLNIEFERFAEWEEGIQMGVWENKEWIDCSEQSEQWVAVAQS
ncbi:MAG: hypothetical protein WD469_02530 [Paenibacillaceae bacterium]